MAALPDPVPSFWWSGDRTERYWVEQLRTDEYGDRLIAPDGPLVRHDARGGGRGPGTALVLGTTPGRRPRRSGVHAVSRVIGRLRPSTDLWEGSACVEIPLTRRTMLDRPVLLADLKRREDEFLGLVGGPRRDGRADAPPFPVAVPSHRPEADDEVPHQAHPGRRRGDRRGPPAPGDRHDPRLSTGHGGRPVRGACGASGPPDRGPARPAGPPAGRTPGCDGSPPGR